MVLLLIRQKRIGNPVKIGNGCAAVMGYNSFNIKPLLTKAGRH